MTPELFQRYLEGLCTVEEKKQVEHWLHTSSEKELDALLLPRFTNGQTTMPQQQANQLWQQLESAVQQQPAKRINLYVKMMAAASVLLLLMAGWWFINKKEHKAPVKAAVVQQPVNDWLHIINTTHHKKEIQLSDGSVVTLHPQAQIQYKKDFNTNERAIYLTGKALFKVAKDKSRPFTVYSGAVSTTALGTVFTVHAPAGQQHIIVHLYEGKVVVRQAHQPSTYLLPGQELTCDMRTHTTIVSKLPNTKPVTVAKKPVRITTLSFNNAPLPEVFDKLKIQYTTAIEYNKADVDSMYFTGTISVKDALPMVLKVITQMNDLELQQQDKRFIVRPPSR